MNSNITTYQNSRSNPLCRSLPPVLPRVRPSQPAPRREMSLMWIEATPEPHFLQVKFY